MRGTQKALMARGLDAKSAEKLSNEGWTLNKLKQTDREALKLIGLSRVRTH